MNCANVFSSSFSIFSALSSSATHRHHCRHCGRLVCYNCAPTELTRDYFPQFILDVFAENKIRVCLVCEDILRSNHDHP
jgi:hypothetical protein